MLEKFSPQCTAEKQTKTEHKKPTTSGSVTELLENSFNFSMITVVFPATPRFSVEVQKSQYSF